MDKNWDLLLKKAEEFNISLSNDQQDQFKEYWRFLDEYNKHTNLVSNSDQEIVIKKHFIDSLAIGLLKDKLGWNTEKVLIDIGIGGGFPGIPIIIANPKWKLCAVDSVGKKTKFIELLSGHLRIQDRVEVVNARAEDLAQDKNKREKFDIAVTRAVGQLSIIAEYCLPFVKNDGYFVAYKAKDVESEISQTKRALSILGGKVEDTVAYDLLDDEIVERNLILINKIKLTPANYPRKAGTPRKNPL